MFQNVVTNKLEGGDRQKAMKRLRVPPLGEQVRACAGDACADVNAHCTAERRLRILK